MALNPIAACATLGVPHGCPWPEIQRAYKRNLLISHPDKGGSAEDFRRITRAYECLKRRHSFARRSRPGVAAEAPKGTRCPTASASGSLKRAARPAPGRLSSLIDSCVDGYLQRLPSPARVTKRAKLSSEADPVETWRKDALAMADLVSCGMVPIAGLSKSTSRKTMSDEALAHSSKSGVARSKSVSEHAFQGSSTESLCELAGRLHSASAEERRSIILSLPIERRSALQQYIQGVDKQRKRIVSQSSSSADISKTTNALPSRQAVNGLRMDLRKRVQALLMAQDIPLVAKQLREVDKVDRRSLIEALPADTQQALQKHLLAERRSVVRAPVSTPSHN